MDINLTSTALTNKCCCNLDICLDRKLTLSTKHQCLTQTEYHGRHRVDSYRCPYVFSGLCIAEEDINALMCKMYNFEKIEEELADQREELAEKKKKEVAKTKGKRKDKTQALQVLAPIAEKSIGKADQVTANKAKKALQEAARQVQACSSNQAKVIQNTLSFACYSIVIDQETMKKDS
jgi:hypothetical protein